MYYLLYFLLFCAMESKEIKVYTFVTFMVEEVKNTCKHLEKKEQNTFKYQKREFNVGFLVKQKKYYNFFHTIKGMLLFVFSFKGNQGATECG